MVVVVVLPARSGRLVGRGLLVVWEAVQQEVVAWIEEQLGELELVLEEVLVSKWAGLRRVGLA